MISKDLLDILACALCKTPVRLDGDKLICQNAECGCRYVVRDDIPNMLIEDAERPCPGCGTQREWDADNDLLRCTKCGKTFQWVAGGVAPTVKP